MHRIIKFVVVAFGVTGFALTPSQAAKHEDRQAEQFVHKVADRGFAIIDNAQWTPDQKRQQFRDLMAKHISFRFFGRSALGPFARVPTEQQFNSYIELLKDYAAYAMQSQLNEYTGQAMRVLSSRVRDSGRLAYVSVDSEVYDRSSGRVEGSAKWVLIRRLEVSASGGGVRKAQAEKANGSYKVYDLVLQTAGESASFSLLQTQRDEFTAILTKNRRNFDALLKHIRAQIRKIREPR